MRYFIVRYFRKADGRVDEATAVSKRIKVNDLQVAAVILDFKELKVVKASMDGVVLPRDFNRIASFYHKHYPNIIERLFRENGYEVKVEEPGSPDPS